MMPLGSVLIGAVSQHVGAPAAVLGQGIIGVIIALAFARFLTRREKNDVTMNEGTAVTK